MADITGKSLWRSPRIWVGGTALSSLFTRIPEDGIAPVISLLVGYFSSSTVELFTTWLFIAIVFYTFAPLAYSLIETLPRENFGFRTIFACGGIAFGVLFSGNLGNSLTGFFTMLILITIISSTFLWYISDVCGRNLLDMNGPTGKIIEFFIDSSIKKEALVDFKNIQEDYGHIGQIFVLVYVGIIITIPVLLAGWTVEIFIIASPVPELLLLGWVLAASISDRIKLGPSKRYVIDNKFDFEEYVVDQLENATRSSLGFVLSLFILIGIFVYGSFFTFGISAMFILIIERPNMREANAENLSEFFLIFWDALGIIIILAIIGGYGIWAWIREWQRLPYFLDQWEERDTVSGEPVSRPHGFIIFPAVVLGFLGIRSILIYNGADTSVLRYIWSVLWPIFIGVGVLDIVYTLKKPPQSVVNEDSWIIIKFLILTIILVILFIELSLISVLLLTIYIGVMPKISRYNLNNTDSNILAWYYFSGSVLFILSPMVISDIPHLLYIGGIVFFIGGTIQIGLHESLTE